MTQDRDPLAPRALALRALAHPLRWKLIDLIASEQAALSAGWQGDTGMSYQAWQAQWNQAMEQLVLAYRAMAGTHENNTTSMLARDQAEGAKWGG